MVVTKRLTRRESQTQTQEKLIAAAYKAFVKHGFDGAAVDAIAADAGYSRGAFYANFPSKEHLFLIVMERQAQADLDLMNAICASPQPPEERLRLLREAYCSLASDRPWAVLSSEYQATALRNSAIRRSFTAKLRQLERRGAEIVQELASSLHLHLSADPLEIISGLFSLCHGVALRQVLHRTQSTEGHDRKVLLLCFDRLMGIEEGLLQKMKSQVGKKAKGKSSQCAT